MNIDEQLLEDLRKIDTYIIEKLEDTEIDDSLVETKEVKLDFSLKKVKLIEYSYHENRFKVSILEFIEEYEHFILFRHVRSKCRECYRKADLLYYYRNRQLEILE